MLKKHSFLPNFCPKSSAFLLIYYHFLLIFAHFSLAYLAQTAQTNPSIPVFTSKTHIPPKKTSKIPVFPQFWIILVLF